MSLALAFPLFLLPAEVTPPPANEPPPEPTAAKSELTVERRDAPDGGPAHRVVFAEVLGNGLLYSVNYERLFERWNIGLRAGASFFTYGVSSYGRSGNLTIVSFPLMASYYFGWEKHKIQVGLGTTILHTQVATDSRGIAYEGERAGTAVAPTAAIGYRYLPRRSGVSFGIGFTPLLRASKFLPWGGATLGYAF